MRNTIDYVLNAYPILQQDSKGHCLWAYYNLYSMVNIMLSCTHAHSSLEFHVPELKCPLATVSGEAYHRNDGANQLALFLRGALYLSSSTLAQLMVQRAHEEDSRFLPQLTANILLLVQTLIQGMESAVSATCPACTVWVLPMLCEACYCNGIGLRNCGSVGLLYSWENFTMVEKLPTGTIQS